MDLECHRICRVSFTNHRVLRRGAMTFATYGLREFGRGARERYGDERKRTESAQNPQHSRKKPERFITAAR
jgi:hypothetical protein